MPNSDEDNKLNESGDEQDEREEETEAESEESADVEVDETSPDSSSENTSMASAEQASGAVEAPPETAEPREEIPQDEICRRVEAVLFSASEPMAPREIARSAKVLTKQVCEAVELLRRQYSETNRSFEICEEAGGYIVLTKPGFAQFVIPPEKTAGERKLTPAALEVLAVVAYEQPVSRLDVEAVRGVASGPILRALMEKGLVQVAGRGEGLGNPLLYGTTGRFLEVMGLASLKDLPDPDTVEG